MNFDITAIRNMSSAAVRESAKKSSITKADTYVDTSFNDFLGMAIDNINTTNSYLSDKENEEIKWALGESENTHDLGIAIQKAYTALQYTVAIRDKLLEAYREIMQMQI